MHLPAFDPGLVVVETDGPGAVAHLVRESDATRVLWIDAGGAATTDALAGGGPRSLRGIRVARAFTAHQHHALVRQAVRAADGRTDLVAAPNLAALYRAADAPDAEIDRLYAATCELLAGLGESLAVPVLAAAPDGTDRFRDPLADRATQTVSCLDTDLGYAVDAPGFTPPGYWQDGWWQTTVPYWVELCESVEPTVGEPRPTPAIQ